MYEKDYDGKYKPTCHRLNERPVTKSKYYNKLTTVSLPNSLKKIQGNAFYDCAALTEITIPAQVTLIGSYAFIGCSLENVYFENTEGWTRSGVISLNVSDPQTNAQKLISSDSTSWRREE